MFHCFVHAFFSVYCSIRLFHNSRRRRRRVLDDQNAERVFSWRYKSAAEYMKARVSGGGRYLKYRNEKCRTAKRESSKLRKRDIHTALQANVE